VLTKVIKAGIGFSNLRSEDIILATYPKSGSTWLRFILCNWLSLTETGNEAVTFDMVDRILPEIGVSDLAEPWRYVAVPRFVKTHWRRNPLFGSSVRIMLLVRDPRDVMVSLHHHLTSRKQKAYDGSLQDLLRDKKLGLDTWFKHALSWSHKRTSIIRYEELKSEGVSVLMRVLRDLDIKYESKILIQAYELSRFDQMRKVEAENGVMRGIFKEGKEFVRSGKSAQWEELFTASDLELYSGLMEQYRSDLPLNLLYN
jgi:Sulfotransferase domain